jgi:hypothetical protein
VVLTTGTASGHGAPRSRDNGDPSNAAVTAAAGSTTGAGPGCAVAVSRSRTSCGPRSGRTCQTSAAVAETTGAAKLVPVNGAGVPTMTDDPPSLSSTAETGPPGAWMSTHGPATL